MGIDRSGAAVMNKAIVAVTAIAAVTLLTITGHGGAVRDMLGGAAVIVLLLFMVTLL